MEKRQRRSPVKPSQMEDLSQVSGRSEMCLSRLQVPKEQLGIRVLGLAELSCRRALPSSHGQSVPFAGRKRIQQGLGFFCQLDGST